VDRPPLRSDRERHSLRGRRAAIPRPARILPFLPGGARAHSPALARPPDSESTPRRNAAPRHPRTCCRPTPSPPHLTHVRTVSRHGSRARGRSRRPGGHAAALCLPVRYSASRASTSSLYGILPPRARLNLPRPRACEPRSCGRQDSGRWSLFTDSSATSR